jgi:hypothetical protein
MKRLSGIIVVAAVLALASCGGGGSSASLDSFFPADNEVSGWTRTPTGSVPDVANGFNAAEALVDGDADPFNTAPSPFVAFGWQLYTNGDYAMDFRIWEMPDAAGCASLWEYLLSDAATYKSKTWGAESIGDAGHSAEGAAFWWINSCADKYFLEARVSLSAGGAPDQTAHDDGVAFMQYVAGLI